MSRRSIGWSIAARLGTAAAILLLATAAECRAVTLLFSYYADPLGTVSGSLVGTLEADHNTFDATALSSLSFNGTPVTLSPPTVQSMDYANGVGSTALPAIVTLNGVYLDLMICDACDPAGTLNGVEFAVGNQTAAAIGVGPLVAFLGPSFGGGSGATSNPPDPSVGIFAFDDGSWHAEIAPELATPWLAGAGLALAAWLRRRRQLVA